MKSVPVENSVGMVLCHDITKIIPGEFKGVAFKKGHIIKEQDIKELLDIGKKNIYVWDTTEEGMIHENDAGERIANAIAGKEIEFSKPSEGKVSLIAKCDGLLKVKRDLLEKINDIDEAMAATLHTDTLISKGTIVAGTRIIPLLIDENKIKKIEDICLKEGSIIWIQPLKKMKVGVVTTGSEVYTGRIKDKFGPVIKDKIQKIGSEVVKQILVSDSSSMIKETINELINIGCNMIVTTGGMSVDPDDVTPTGIKESGANIVTYGAPVLPGAMFLVAYKGEIPILGLPGCVMYSKTTVFDLILPKIAAGEKITKKDITRLGHSGMCTNCTNCTFPNCSFGKW